MDYILVSIFFGFITGAIGRYIAKEKNRSTVEGFWFGFLLSLLGVLVIALLPNKEKIFLNEDRFLYKNIKNYGSEKSLLWSYLINKEFSSSISIFKIIPIKDKMFWTSILLIIGLYSIAFLLNS